jgi:hypothetical protein
VLLLLWDGIGTRKIHALFCLQRTRGKGVCAAKKGGDQSMKRESLLNLRTCREIVTGMDIAREKRPSSTMLQRMRRIIARSTKEITPHLNEATLAVELDKERRRFKRRFETVERSAAKILGFRQKLANTHEKNRRIMDLRVELQRQYWNGTSRLKSRSEQTVGAAASTGETTPRFKVKRLRYGGRS